MTIEEARKLLPPGWVECDEAQWSKSETGLRYDLKWLEEAIYAIPAPKPGHRRVPMGEMVIEFNRNGNPSMVPITSSAIRGACGGYDAIANTKWRLDTDTREWVEVLE